MRRPLLPASSYVRTITMPRFCAYSRITSLWFSVEYCWCSVDMRTYSAACAGLGLSRGGLTDGEFGLSIVGTSGNVLGHAGAMRILRFTPDLIREEIVAGRCWRGDPQGPCGPSRLCLLYSFSAANAKRMFFTPKSGCFCPAGYATVRRLYADFGRRHVRAAPPGSSSCNPGYSSSTFPCCSDRSLGILNRRPTFAGDSLPGGAVDTPRRHKLAGRGEIGMFGIPGHNTDRSLFS